MALHDRKRVPSSPWQWVPTPRLLLMLLPSVCMLIAVACTPSLEGKRLAPLPALCAPLLLIVAFVLLWVGTRTPLPTWVVTLRGYLPGWLAARPLRILVITPWVLYGLLALFSNGRAALQAKPYYNGSLAYLHIGADAIIQRHDPYSSSDLLWSASLRWPNLLATPLVRGIYAGQPLHYPSPHALQTLMHQEVRDMLQRHGEFDPATAHNYPAAAYWMVLPVVWSGGSSVLWLNFAAILAMELLVLLRAPPGVRPMLGLVLVGQTIVYYTSFDALSLVFVLAAWQMMARPRLSAGLLGWACAVKQLAWFFVPFYLIEVARRSGWRAAREQGCWLLGWFLLPNLPFIIANPGSWLSSQLVPMRAPMFPGGIGIVAPAIGGLWPLWPPVVYGVLELLAWLGLIVWQARRQSVNSDGLLLALIPLIFAWRSFGIYFALLPLLALWMIASKMSASESLGARSASQSASG